MARIFRTKISILPIIFLLSLLFSCDKDAELLSDHMLEEEKIAVLDDNFRVPSHRISVLDVLSNDNYISSGNTRIVEITPASKGRIQINEDNTITYIPETANIEEMVVESPSAKTPTVDITTEEVDTDTDPTSETPTEEVATTEETSVETIPDENTSEESATEEMTATKETVTETATPQETPAQPTPAQEPTPKEDIAQESESEETTSEETATEEDTSTEDVGTSENPSSETGETSMEDSTSNTEEATTEAKQGDSPSIVTTDENTTEDTPIEEIQEDSFTYTTETENEDGTVTTETATVTVKVESAPMAHAEVTPETKISPETDYWRDPVIAGSRLLDEKYYDLDTGEIYAKEVNLQRGQLENYIEHENCPQRIKDKWDNRIEISPSDVNGSQNGLQAIFNIHPEGSLFYLRAGVYQDQKNAILKSHQDIVGEYGSLLDGSGINGDSDAAARAVRSQNGGYICNLKIRDYPTWYDPQNPHAPSGAAVQTSQNGAILNCDIHANNIAIAVIWGSKAMWNKFTGGRLGIFGWGSSDPNDPKRRGTIVKYNEWFDCNFNDNYQHYEAGGSKFVQIDGVIWSHNYIHDNPTGSGIWQDGENRDSEIYKNVIINTYRSIFSETSHTSNIHHNTIEYGTGFGAVYMSNSQGEKVHHNFIRWSRNGIAIRDLKRGTSKIYPGQALRGKNNEIYNNHIWQRLGSKEWTIGLATAFDGDIDSNNYSNRWHDNRYYIDDNEEGAALFSEDKPFTEVFVFSRLKIDHAPISWEEWKKHAGEENSTLEYEQFY